MTTAFPFKVSFDINDAVVPPAVPFIGDVVSFTASIIGALTVTFIEAELQFVGFSFSQI